MNFKKTLVGLLTATMVGCCSLASAEVTIVNADLRKDVSAGVGKLLLSKTADNIFENTNLKVELEDVRLHGFASWNKGSARKQFLEAHEDSVVHFWQTALDGAVWWLSPTTAICNFTNKSNQKMILDLSRSKISIGEYYGMPLLLGESVVTFEPQETKMIPLFRRDPIIVKTGPGTTGEVFPSDLSLSKNVLGRGEYQFAVSYEGSDVVEYVPVHFEAKLNRTIMSRYIKKVINK